MKDAKYILRLTLTLFLITAVVAGLLGLVNYLTEDRIDELTRQKAEAAMQEVFPAGNYEEIPAGEDGITAAYRADDAGYVVPWVPTAPARTSAPGSLAPPTLVPSVRTAAALTPSPAPPSPPAPWSPV